jgi:hypothetical protein
MVEAAEASSRFAFDSSDSPYFPPLLPPEAGRDRRDPIDFM